MKARYVVIPVVVVAVVVATAFWISRSLNRSPEYELYEADRGQVAQTVAVSGSVISADKVELGFLSPGIVKEVAVKVGDEVEAGSLLVALDTKVLEYQAAQARANAAAAQAMAQKAQNSLRPQDRAVLSRTLESSRVALNNARHNLSEARRAREIEIDNARTNLDSAQLAYNNALNIYNSSQSAISQSAQIAKVALDNALSALTQAQSQYNMTLSLYQSGQASLSEVWQAESGLTQANSAYASAKASYDAAVQQSSVEQAGARANLDAARSRLDAAEAAYNTAVFAADNKVQSASNALSSAEAGYALAEAQFNQANAPAHAADVSASRNQAAAAYASLRSVEAQIERSRLRAPIAGIVTEVNAVAGELTSLSGPAVVLQNDGELLIEAYISEVDIDSLALGQEVKVEFDALDDVVKRGEVISIDPAATVVSGVINYRVEVALPEPVAGLRPSMTADLEILTDRRDGVIALPRRAVRRHDDGIGYFVRILTDDGVEERSVEVGLMGDTEVEIVSGLSEGDQVVLREL